MTFPIFQSFCCQHPLINYIDSIGAADVSITEADGKKQRKTYSIDVKLNAIREAERTSNREVARILGTDEGSVRHWRKTEDQLIQSKAQGGQMRSKGGGRKVRHPLLEKILFEWYSQQTSNGIKVTGTMLRNKAQEISVETGSEKIKFSDGWLTGFTKRHGINLDKKNKVTGNMKEEHINIEPEIDPYYYEHLNEVKTEPLGEETYEDFHEGTYENTEYSYEGYEGYEGHEGFEGHEGYEGYEESQFENGSSKPPTFNCTICNSEFNKKYKLQQHIAESGHKTKPAKRAKKRFPCDFCGKDFSTKQYQRRHILTVHEETSAL